MIQKKTTKGDLEKRRNTYFSLGLVLVLALIYVCFELLATQDPAPVFVLPDDGFVEIIDDQVAATDQTPPQETQQQQQQQQEAILNVVDDHIAVSANFNFDIESTEDLVITDYVPIDIVQEKIEDLPPPVRFAEEMPDFPGGMEEFYKYLQSNLVYPELARINNISGVVLVEFVVERDGSVSNVKVISSLYVECDKAAVTVIQKSPKWKPGKSMGQPVRCFYNIPVQFTLM